MSTIELDRGHVEETIGFDVTRPPDDRVVGTASCPLREPSWR